MQAKSLLERFNIVTAVVPINLATGANNGDWVSLKGYERCAIVLIKGAGASGEPPILKLQQATDVSGTSAKDCATITTVFTQIGADVTALTAWTKVTQAAATSYAPAAGDSQGIIAYEVEAAMLDRANGFDCIQASIADVGATSQIGTVIYILGDARYETTPANLVDPRAN